MDIDFFVTKLEVKLDKVFTDEQREFIKDITTPCFVYADPGTGKTASATAALLTAELAHGIPGNSIYALSFTNKATSELAVRHKLACDRLHIKQSVNFKTLHKMCTKILKDNYMLLGLDSLTIGEPMSNQDMFKMIEDIIEERQLQINPNNIKNILKAIKKLNSSLVFDRDHVVNSVDFLDCKTNYEDFTTLRKMLYSYNKIIGRIPVDSIMLYTLELLKKNEDLRKKLKKSCRIMLVDEAQDLSLLQLGLVCMLTDCPVLIGDLKQQIFGFQGACPEIKREFFKLHPEARDMKLTQSFRCYDRIADFSIPTILKNNVGGESFKGCKEGGEVNIRREMNVEGICKQLKDEYYSNKRNFNKSVLFLYRNNYSAMPLIEELYKQDVPFRTYKYPGARNIPYISELCDLIEFAKSPDTPGLDRALKYIIPEFRGDENNMTPIARVAKKLGCSIMDTNYGFRDEGIGSRAMNLITEVQELLRKGATMDTILSVMIPVFQETYVEEYEKYRDKTFMYYLGLATPVFKGKTYDKFISDERDKLEKTEEWERLREGVRCYTMHAAKGLEADIVHIIDADADILPNVKMLDKTIKKGCMLDAARDLRNERSLVYVACTRAKEQLNIYYTSELSPLFTGNDIEYDALDNYYANNPVDFDDLSAFYNFEEEV